MTADAEGHDLFTRYLHVTRQSHHAPAKSPVVVRENVPTDSILSLSGS